MRIEQLQAFLAITETRNFGEAAKSCAITQSTISRQIRSLEQDLGLTLFHRNAQTKLTIGGEKLLPRAQKICQEWTKAVQECSDLIEGKQSELCVAAIHSVCAYYLPPVLQQFCQDFPQTQLRVTALGSDRALKVLKDGLIDIAIVMQNDLLSSSPDMRILPLYSEKISVLMAADHPLTAYEQIPLVQLANYPQVVFKDGYGMQRLVHEWFNKQKLELNTVMELNTLDAFRGVVRQGNIVALLPQGALIGATKDGDLAIRPITFPSDPALSSLQGSSLQGETQNNLSHKSLTREVVMVTTTDRLSIPPIAHFFELAKTQLQNLSFTNNLN